MKNENDAKILYFKVTKTNYNFLALTMLSSFVQKTRFSLLGVQVNKPNTKPF